MRVFAWVTERPAHVALPFLDDEACYADNISLQSTSLSVYHLVKLFQSDHRYLLQRTNFVCPESANAFRVLSKASQQSACMLTMQS